jgi:hypothetical protein
MMVCAFALFLLGVSPDGGPRPIEPRDESDAGVPISDGGVAEPQVPGVVVTARVEPDPVVFGNAFDLVVTLKRDRGVRLEMPAQLPDVDSAPRTGEPRRSVVEIPSPADAGTGNARVEETIRIPFLALGLDDVKTPAFTLKDKDGAVVDVPSLPVRVTDDPSLLAGPDGGVVDPQQLGLEPNVPAMAYAVPDYRPYYVGGALVGGGALFFLVRWLLRRRRDMMPPPPPPPPPPPRPAHEIALERLEALLASGLLQRGETATFVERLMDEVLRDYIAARFTLPAGTRTTRELVKELLGVTVPGLDVKLVESLLADADLVKFAKATISPEHAHAMATRVRMLIEATKVVPT